MTPLTSYLQILEQRLGILTHMLLEDTLPDLGPVQQAAAERLLGRIAESYHFV